MRCVRFPTTAVATAVMRLPLTPLEIYQGFDRRLQPGRRSGEPLRSARVVRLHADHPYATCHLHRVMPCSFMTYPVLLNEHSLYEHILDDDIFMGVVGILECPWLQHLSCNVLHPNLIVQTTQSSPTTKPTTGTSCARRRVSTSRSRSETIPSIARFTIHTGCNSSRTSYSREPLTTRRSTC